MKWWPWGRPIDRSFDLSHWKEILDNMARLTTGNVEIRRDDKGRLHAYVDGTPIQAVQSIKIEHTHPDSCTVQLTLLGRFVQLTTEGGPPDCDTLPEIKE